MQTKKQSFIESLTNVAIGYCISLLSLFIIFPISGNPHTMIFTAKYNVKIKYNGKQ